MKLFVCNQFFYNKLFEIKSNVPKHKHAYCILQKKTIKLSYSDFNQKS